MDLIPGVAWSDLTTNRLEAFLAEAGGEPLSWEAKADDARERLRPETVRRELCAFANSERGGYLIIGAKRIEGVWAMPGLINNPPGDLPVWVSQIADRIDPRPAIDVQDWPITGDRGAVGVVWVPPVTEPPAIVSDGTIYHRVAGATRAVTDGRLLAELFRRGEAARDLAVSMADGLLEQIGLSTETFGNFVFAATGGPRGYASPLFTQRVVHEIEAAAADTFLGDERRRPYRTELTARSIEVTVDTVGSIPRIAVRATRFGTVAVRFITQPNTFAHAAATIVGQDWPSTAWQAAIRVHQALRSTGSMYVTAAVNLQFGQPGYRARPEPCVRLWTELGPVGDGDLALIGREIRRTGGEEVLDDEA